MDRSLDVKLVPAGPCRFRIPRAGPMRTDGLIYATREMIAALGEDQAPRQAANVDGRDRVPDALPTRRGAGHGHELHLCSTSARLARMAAKNPRVMVVLDPPLYRWLKRSAKAGGLSLSLRLRDVVREAYELHEDRYWAREGERRLRTFDRARAVSHDRVWRS